MRLPLFIAVCFLSFQVLAQSYFPKGQYYSRYELEMKKPRTTYSLYVESRSNADILMDGGNRFFVHPYRRVITSNMLSRNIIAHSDGKELYLNTRYFVESTGQFYSIAEDVGKYIIFMARPSSWSFFPGPSIGAAAGVANIGKYIPNIPTGKMRCCIIETDSFKAYAVNNELLLSLVGQFPDLMEQMGSEVSDTTKQIDPLLFQLKYLKKVNDKFREKN